MYFLYYFKRFLNISYRTIVFYNGLKYLFVIYPHKNGKEHSAILATKSHLIHCGFLSRRHKIFVYFWTPVKTQFSEMHYDGDNKPPYRFRIYRSCTISKHRSISILTSYNIKKILSNEIYFQIFGQFRNI